MWHVNGRSMLFHLLGISFIISLEMYVSVKLAGWKPIDQYILLYILNIAFFFLQGKLLFEQLFKGGKNSLIFIFLVLISLAIHFEAILAVLFYNNERFQLARGLEREVFYVNAGYRSVLVGGYSAAYALATHNKRRERQKRKLENGYLLALLNPHHIYNSLYFVKVEMKSNPERAEKMLDLLSRSLQFSWENLSEDGKITLEKELEHVTRLIEMHKLRFEEKFYLDILTEVDANQAKTIKILPLLLFTLVENMLKYAVLDRPENPASLTIKCKRGVLEIQIVNKKLPEANLPKSGQGMRITTDRLKNTYGRRHQLIVEDTDNMYVLKLNISL